MNKTERGNGTLKCIFMWSNGRSVIASACLEIERNARPNERQRRPWFWDSSTGRVHRASRGFSQSGNKFVMKKGEKGTANKYVHIHGTNATNFKPFSFVRVFLFTTTSSSASTGNIFMLNLIGINSCALLLRRRCCFLSMRNNRSRGNAKTMNGGHGKGRTWNECKKKLEIVDTAAVNYSPFSLTGPSAYERQATNCARYSHHTFSYLKGKQKLGIYSRN